MTKTLKIDEVKDGVNTLIETLKLEPQGEISMFTDQEIEQIKKQYDYESKVIAFIAGFYQIEIMRENMENQPSYLFMHMLGGRVRDIVTLRGMACWSSTRVCLNLFECINTLIHEAENIIFNDEDMKCFVYPGMTATNTKLYIKGVKSHMQKASVVFNKWEECQTANYELFNDFKKIDR